MRKTPVTDAAVRRRASVAMTHLNGMPSGARVIISLVLLALTSILESSAKMVPSIRQESRLTRSSRASAVIIGTLIAQYSQFRAFDNFRRYLALQVLAIAGFAEQAAGLDHDLAAQ